MITTRYVDVAFNGGRSAMARALYQYDYGQILRITDLDLPVAYEVHFADGKTGNSVTQIGNADGVNIPDAMLLKSGSFYAWFYLHETASDGETRYEILFPVMQRAKPTNQEPTPVQQDAITEAIAALNAAVEQTGADVIAAGESASAAADSADEASGYASDASASAINAGEYAEDAQGYASSASESATAAGNAQTAAETAQGKAETAQGKAEDAQTAAEAAAAQTALDVIAAGQSANAAAGSAGEASGYANDASGYATAAQGFANNASGFADNASGYATNAYNSAQAAAGSAGEASGYATTASGYATDANNAKIAAQGAQTSAETAQGLAEAAQTGAEAAQTAAESARDAAIAATEDKAPVILDSASGAIVSISDGANGMNARSLVVAFSPIQSGSGDPSPDNVRPISGRTGATITRTGSNLLDESTRTVYGDGKGLRWCQANGFTLKAGQTYTFTVSGSSQLIRMYIIDNATNTTIIDGNTSITYTPTTDRRVHFQAYRGTAIEDSNVFMLNLGSTALPYEPYVGTNYPVIWQTEAGTVYGGTVDVVTGVLTVTHAMVDLGTLTWGYDSIRDAFSAIPSPTPKRFFVGVCSTYPFVGSYENLVDYSCAYIYYNYIAIRDNDYADAAAFKTAMTGVQFAYELAEPQTYQLDPQTVSMLLGANNVWATGDTVDLTYPCDTRLYIEKLTRPTEDDMVANANIPIHKFFMIGNTLYYSTAAIASGESIVVGTNCSRVSLADALNQINA